MNHPTTPLPTRDAASVVLLRDGPQGLEVLLLRRHHDSRVLGGAYVFPGGKLDPEDASPDALARLDDSAPRLHQRLGEPELTPGHAASLYVAALRETWEEAGVLLATPTPAAQRQLGALAQALRDGQPWPAAMAALGLHWHTQAVLPWSRWITPRQPLLPSPRFDTRFFLAPLPVGQSAQADQYEASEALWVRPRDALLGHRDGRMHLIPPQLMALAELARHPNLASAWSAALVQRPRCILPEVTRCDGEPAMCYPGDPLHPNPERAMPGPTRLRIANGRFVPFGGFESWFQ